MINELEKILKHNEQLKIHEEKNHYYRLCIEKIK